MWFSCVCLWLFHVFFVVYTFVSFCNSFFGLFLVVLAFFVVVFVSFCGCSLSLLVALCFFCVVLCHFIVVLCLFAVDIESFEGVHDTFWLSEHHLFTVQRWSWSPIGLSHSVGSTVTSYFLKSVKVFFFWWVVSLPIYFSLKCCQLSYLYHHQNHLCLVSKHRRTAKWTFTKSD